VVHLENVLPARGQKRRKHHPALPYERMAEFMLALQKKNGIAPLALEFTILTAARTSETIGARWSEFNLAEQVWTVPANRIKGEREHRVPLTGHVVATLQGLPREEGNPFVFIGQAGTGLSNNAMAALLQRMNEENKKAGRPLYVDPKQNNRPIVPHGFRSAFRDWAAERTNFPNFVVEMALAHTVGDKVEGGYRRTDLYDKRRKLMEAWATYCATPAASSAKVLSLRGRQ
jgi:integrase